jgi:hypothetical protein
MAETAGVTTAALERRRLDLKGKHAPVEVVVIGWT